jgi:hypothetical protein
VKIDVVDDYDSIFDRDRPFSAPPHPDGLRWLLGLLFMPE